MQGFPRCGLVKGTLRRFLLLGCSGSNRNACCSDAYRNNVLGPLKPSAFFSVQSWSVDLRNITPIAERQIGDM